MVVFALNIVEEIENDKPRNYVEAINSNQSQNWIATMYEEISSLQKNDTWVLVEKPKGARVVICKWIFKLKEEIPGIEKARFKARLVVRGFTQRERVDYNDVFSPVIKHSSIRMILALVVQNNLELEQLDVRTTFLHGELDEKIHMT